MKADQNGAVAALTEVKNKLGEVLSLADEYGEVTITSYNRPKYKLVRILSSARSEPEKPVSTQPIGRSRNPLAIGANVIGMFAGISSAELWERNSRREQTWARNALKGY